APVFSPVPDHALAALVPSFLPRASRVFFFYPPAPPVIYTLSLHDALPISRPMSTAVRTLPRNGTDRSHFMAACLRHSASISVPGDRKSTRLNSSHGSISYAVFCLKKKKRTTELARRIP